MHQTDPRAATYRLSSTGGSDLTFRGRMCALVSTRFFGGQKTEEWFELATYRDTGGRWIAHVRRATEAAAGPPYEEHFACETLAEIERLLGSLCDRFGSEPLRAALDRSLRDASRAGS